MAINLCLRVLAPQRARALYAGHGWVACKCASLLLFALPRRASSKVLTGDGLLAPWSRTRGCNEAPAQASHGAGLVGSWATLQWRDGGLEAFTPQPLRARPLAHPHACPANNDSRAYMPAMMSAARLRKRPAHDGATQRAPCSGAGRFVPTRTDFQAARRLEAMIMDAHNGETPISLMTANVVSKVPSHALCASLAIWHLVAEARLPPHAGARFAAGMHCRPWPGYGCCKGVTRPLSIFMWPARWVAGACMRMHVSSSASQP